MEVEREEIKHKNDDEKERLKRIIQLRIDAVRMADERVQQAADDSFALRSKYDDLLKETQAKDVLIAEMKETLDVNVENHERSIRSSERTLTTVRRQTELRITRMENAHRKEVEEFGERNKELHDQLDKNSGLTPVTVLHEAQVDNVSEMHEKLFQIQKEKKEELSAKEKENENLRTCNGQQERKIRDLEAEANAGRGLLEKTANVLRETQKALHEAEKTIKSHERDNRSLTRCEKWWKDSYHRKDNECVTLKSRMETLKANQRMELIKAENRNKSLLDNEVLQEINDKLSNDMKSWDNGHSSSSSVFVPKDQAMQLEDETKSAANMLKIAKANAEAMQKRVDTLQEENDGYKTQLQNATSTAQIQEQMGCLKTENQHLRDAARKAKYVKQRLAADLANKKRGLQKRFVKKRDNFKTQFDDWVKERVETLEEDYHNAVAIDNQKHNDERRINWQQQNEEINRRQLALQGREAQLKTLESDGQASSEIKTRAQDAEAKVQKLEEAARNDWINWNLVEAAKEKELVAAKEKVQQLEEAARNDRNDWDLIAAAKEKELVAANEKVQQLEEAARNDRNDWDLAEAAKEKVQKFEDAAKNDPINWNLVEAAKEKEIQSQMRVAQRHLELLNEETGKMAAEDYRIRFFHFDLQTANLSINKFKYDMKNVGQGVEGLTQILCDFDFSESDVLFLQEQRRPVLLAQLQAAKRTMNKLRAILAGKTKVDVESALSIAIGPRGDEDAAPEIENIFGTSDEDQHFAHQQTSRKRSASPLSNSRHDDHEEDAAFDDWGDQDQGGPPDARFSTTDEPLDQQRSGQKHRRTG